MAMCRKGCFCNQGDLWNTSRYLRTLSIGDHLSKESYTTWRYFNWNPPTMLCAAFIKKKLSPHPFCCDTSVLIRLGVILDFVYFTRTSLCCHCELYYNLITWPLKCVPDTTTTTITTSTTTAVASATTTLCIWFKLIKNPLMLAFKI